MGSSGGGEFIPDGYGGTRDWPFCDQNNQESEKGFGDGVVELRWES